MKKIPKELRQEFGNLANGMIDELIKEEDKEISVELAIVFVSKYYDIGVKEIKKCLKSVDSIFTSNNNVIYYDFEWKKYIKRTALLAMIGNVYTKIGTKLKKIDSDMDPGVIYETIEREYS
jgi:hypothetical protein